MIDRRRKWTLFPGARFDFTSHGADVTTVLMSSVKFQMYVHKCFSAFVRACVRARLWLNANQRNYLCSDQAYMSHGMTKPTKWPVRPAKTQISLGIRPVWSESSLCARWVANSRGQRRLWSDWAEAQADLSLSWAHRSFFCFCHTAAHIYDEKTIYKKQHL